MIRLHLIIFFENIVDKYVREFFRLDQENELKENLFDLSRIQISEDEFTTERLSQQYS